MIENRYYKQVAGNDTEQSDWVIPSGKKFYMTQIGGDSCYHTDVKVEIIWDATGTPEILFSTHGDNIVPVANREFIGDGSKVIRILLTNDTEASQTIGAFYLGEYYE